MVRIDFVVVGKLKEEYLREACREYLKRLGSYAKVNVVEIPESRLPQNPSASEITDCLQKEGQIILSKITSQTYVVTLCIEGEMFTSIQLAQKLEQAQNQGASHICFIIGGSHGLDDRVKEYSDLRLSMSRMTFPHQLARVMVLEQCYRAFSIQNNSKYHK